jgi:hypothetical protein
MWKHSSELHAAKENGKAEGKAEERAETNKSAIANALQAGYSIEIIKTIPDHDPNHLKTEN